jgi:hypothetical protein
LDFTRYLAGLEVVLPIIFLASRSSFTVSAIVERLFFIDVLSFDWSCPKYITPRYTADEMERVVTPLKQRIAELEAHLEKP